MATNGRLVNTWYWNVARSMRDHGIHMARNIITITVSARLRRCHAAHAAKIIAGMPSQTMIRFSAS